MGVQIGNQDSHVNHISASPQTDTTQQKTAVGHAHNFDAAVITPEYLATAGQGMPHECPLAKEIGQQHISKQEEPNHKEGQPINAQNPTTENPATTQKTQQSWVRATKGEPREGTNGHLTIGTSYNIPRSKIAPNIKELKDSEKSYGDGLRELDTIFKNLDKALENPANLEKFQKALDRHNEKLSEKAKEEGKSFTPLTIQDFKEAKAAYGSAKEANESMQETLKKDDFIGEYTEKYSSYSDSFSGVVNSYDRFIELGSVIDDFHKENPEVGIKPEDAKFPTMGAYLILPVQRSPRHAMFTGDFKSKTPENHPDYQKYAKAEAAVKECTAKINENERKYKRALVEPQINSIKQEGVPELHSLRTNLKHEGVNSTNWDNFINTTESISNKKEAIANMTAEEKSQLKNEVIKTRVAFYKENLSNLTKKKSFFGMLKMKLEHGLMPSKRAQFEHSVNAQIKYLQDYDSKNSDFNNELIAQAEKRRDQILMQSRKSAKAGG